MSATECETRSWYTLAPFPGMRTLPFGYKKPIEMETWISPRNDDSSILATDDDWNDRWDSIDINEELAMERRCRFGAEEPPKWPYRHSITNDYSSPPPLPAGDNMRLNFDRPQRLRRKPSARIAFQKGEGVHLYVEQYPHPDVMKFASFGFIKIERRRLDGNRWQLWNYVEPCETVLQGTSAAYSDTHDLWSKYTGNGKKGRASVAKYHNITITDPDRHLFLYRANYAIHAKNGLLFCESEYSPEWSYAPLRPTSLGDSTTSSQSSPVSNSTSVTSEEAASSTLSLMGLTPLSGLLKAALEGNMEHARRALEGGADINGEDYDGNTALCLATRKFHLEMMGFLLKNGADQNHRNKRGTTPVAFAAMLENNEAIKLLVSWFANVNIADNEGITPLHFATMTASSGDTGDTQVIENLIKYGASTVLFDGDGRTALDISRLMNNTAATTVLTNAYIAEQNAADPRFWPDGTFVASPLARDIGNPMSSGFAEPTSFWSLSTLRGIFAFYLRKIRRCICLLL